MRFIPAGRKLIAETQRQREPRTDSNGILGVPSAEQRAPIHLRRGRVEQKTGNRSAQKRLQAGEGCLSKLAQCNRFVGLKALEPRAEFKLMPPSRQRYMVLERV